MARIPLAEIPGVANQAGPVLADYPGYRVNLGAGPAAQNASLSRVAANGMQSPIGQGAFNGPAQGMQQMAQAVGSVAPVFSELANKLQVAQNLGDMAKAEAVMENARADHAQEAMTVPADQRVALWETKYRPQAEKQLADLRLSPMAASRVMPQWTTFDAKTRTNISYDAYKAKIADNELALDNQKQRGFMNGQPEQVYAAINAKKAFGHSDAAIEAETIAADKVFWEKAKTDQINWISSETANNPWEAAKDLEKAVAGDKSTRFGNLDSVQARHLLGMANQAKASASADLSDDVDQKVLTGIIGNEKQLREYVGYKMPERQILSHFSDLSKMDNYKSDAERQAGVVYNRPVLFQKIDAYDPSNDKTMSDYFSLKDLIKSTMPEGERQDFLEQLSAKRKSGDKGEPELIKAALKTSASLAEGQLYGKFDKKKIEAGDIEEIAKMQKAGEQHALVDQGLKDWAKSNPDKVRDPKAVGDVLKSLVNPTIQENAMQLQRLNESRSINYSAPSGVGIVGGLAPIASPLYGNVIPSTNFSLPKQVGGVDEKYDSNTAKGNAAAGERLLTPGVVAVNTQKYPLGTVFRDSRTGEAFIALDKHGNADPNVVDFYKEPKDYVQSKANRSLHIVDRVTDLPRTVQDVRDLLSKYGKVPPGESAVESLARINESKDQVKNVRTWKQPTSKLANSIPARN